LDGSQNGGCCEWKRDKLQLLYNLLEKSGNVIFKVKGIYWEAVISFLPA